MVETKQLISDWRIKAFLAVLLVIGIAPLVLTGLKFGMDFEGGTVIQVQLEKAVDTPTMNTITSVLETRLNSFGLKDISVKPTGNDYITVEVSEKDKKEVDVLEDILSKQGRFEAIIDGQIALFSDDLTQIITNPQKGYGYISSTGEWRVPFTLSKEGSERFADLAAGKCSGEDQKDCERIFMYIDRPENAVLLVPQNLYDAEKEMYMDASNPSSFPIPIEEVGHNSLTKIIPTDVISESILTELSNYTTIIIPENNTYNTSLLPQEKLEVKPKIGDYWIWDALNLKSVLFLSPGVTGGKPIREAVITGGADNVDEAIQEMTSMVVVLRSGKLPVSLSIASTMIISPSLGKNFLNNSLLIGLLALIAVALVIFFKYRNLKITAVMTLSSMSSMVIILGIASLINWQIDLAAMAGIIAAIGTGVDQLIVITDEAMRGKEEEQNLLNRIKRAFSIVLVAGFTTLAAMFPLMTLGLGMLKGFAITTMIGVIVNLVVIRPTYGKLVERLLK